MNNDKSQSVGENSFLATKMSTMGISSRQKCTPSSYPSLKRIKTEHNGARDITDKPSFRKPAPSAVSHKNKHKEQLQPLIHKLLSKQKHNSEEHPTNGNK